MNKHPCKDCGHRELHCHGKCPDYADYRKELDNIAKAREFDRIATPHTYAYDQFRIRFERRIHLHKPLYK